MDSMLRKNKYFPYLILSPAGIILLVFTLFPFFYVQYISLFEWDIVKGDYVAAQNYGTVFTDSTFWQALLNTFYLALGVVIPTISISFCVAYLLFQKIRFRSFFRTLFFLPFITSTVASAIVWDWIFSSRNYGLANMMMRTFGFPEQNWLFESRGIFEMLGGTLGIHVPVFLSGPSLALTCIIIFTIWHAMGFHIVIFYAGLSQMPQQLLEAAKIDGANQFQLITRIVIPLLSPTIFFLIIISTIGALQIFNQIYMMSHEILGTTDNMVIYIFKIFYQDRRMGVGAAASVILFIIIFSITLFQSKTLGKKVHYQ